jgi:hypothetical protein
MVSHYASPPDMLDHHGSSQRSSIPLSSPAEVGGFTGAVIQLLGLIIALAAAVVSTRQNYRAETPQRG